MIYLTYLSDIDLTTFSVKSKEIKKKNNKIKGALQVGSGLLIGQQAIRSGVPRALGVRLESHSTSKKAAKAILNNGGMVDPNYGGTGASRLADNWAEDAKGRIYITGKHPDGLTPNLDIPKALDNPVFDRFQAKIGRAAYRGQAGAAKLTFLDVLQGITGLKGKSLYIGGSDNYYKNTFIPAPDDYGMVSNKPVKVYGNKAAATLAALEREGGGNRLKGAIKLMRANKGRTAAGLAIAGLGGIAATKLVKSGINNFKPNKVVSNVAADSDPNTRADKGKKRASYKERIKSILKQN